MIGSGMHAVRGDGQQAGMFHLLAFDFSISVMPDPYVTPAMDALKKSILLQVRVPVLSDRMVFTIPSSCRQIDKT